MLITSAYQLLVRGAKLQNIFIFMKHEKHRAIRSDFTATLYIKMGCCLLFGRKQRTKCCKSVLYVTQLKVNVNTQNSL